MCVCSCVILKHCSLLSRNIIFPLTTSRTHATFHEVIYNYKQQARITVPVYILYSYGMLWSCCNCLHIPMDREESNERKYKRTIMAQ